MLKRFAIIIESSNVRGQADLPGARQDAMNWRSFLTSELGGAWRADEMVKHNLNKPSSAHIRSLLDLYDDRYVFLVFSGHGYEEYDRVLGRYVTKICLNESEQDVSIDSISPKQLGTAVFDCCRGVENGQGRVKVANESFSARCRAAFGTAEDTLGFLVRNSTNAQGLARVTVANFFLQSIEKLATRVRVNMYSCRRGESAGEDPNVGGYYTTLLIQGAKAWAEGQRSSQYYAVYNTKQAHDFAVEAMQEVNSEQHPEYDPSWQAYPFAIG